MIGYDELEASIAAVYDTQLSIPPWWPAEDRHEFIDEMAGQATGLVMTELDDIVDRIIDQADPTTSSDAIAAAITAEQHALLAEVRTTVLYDLIPVKGTPPVDALTVADLAAVVYSAGKVFDGLSVNRFDTENFLRSGRLDEVPSRADLALVEDLRDAAQFIVDHAGRTIDSAFVRAVNATVTRSGALHPGRLRRQSQAVGVATPYGRHTPDALTEDGLQALLDAATRSEDDVREHALDLFVNLAKAQPFEDGNKRTAVFVANSLLIGSGAGVLLTIPVDDDDPSLSAMFHDRLARAYVFGEGDGVKELLRDRGLTRFRPQSKKERGRTCPRSNGVSRLGATPGVTGGSELRLSAPALPVTAE